MEQKLNYPTSLRKLGRHGRDRGGSQAAQGLLTWPQEGRGEETWAMGLCVTGTGSQR